MLVRWMFAFAFLANLLMMEMTLRFFADVETNLLPVVKEMLFRDAVGGNLRI